MISPQNRSATWRSFFATASCVAFATGIFLLSSFGDQKTTKVEPKQVKPPEEVIDAKVENLKGVKPNESNAFADLNDIFTFIGEYRLQFGRTLPSSAVNLFRLNKGRDKPLVHIESIVNPDSMFADSPLFREFPNRTVAYQLYNSRWDGTPIGSPKRKGEKDVLSSTEIYYHQNYSVSRGISGPSGYYMLLWDDGSISKLPFDLLLYTESVDKASIIVAFPEAAGVPQNSMTYAERWNIERIGALPQIGKPLSINNREVVDNGGPESVVLLSRRLNFPNSYGINREILWEHLVPSQPEFTLGEIQVGAIKLGLNTKATRQTLPQLQKSGTPALLFLQDDGRIVTLTALDDDRAVVIDRGLTQNVERSVLEKRYSGEALVPIKALTQNVAVTADDAVREVKLPSLDAEVPQLFILRNTGTKPITIQLEYPLLGVTESKLDKDTIAPGEIATLDIKVKWRSILDSSYQNVLISIQTDDPIVPRLQLAVLLTPPKEVR